MSSPGHLQPSQEAVSQAGAQGILYVYALTFAGLKFLVFLDQQPSAKISSRENLDQSGNESAVCKMIASQKCKYCGDLLWQHDMQLRPPPKQLITSIRQGFRGNDESLPWSRLIPSTTSLSSGDAHQSSHT